MRSSVTKLRTGRSRRQRDGVMCDYLAAFDYGLGTKGPKLLMTQAELEAFVYEARIALVQIVPQTEPREP